MEGKVVVDLKGLQAYEQAVRRGMQKGPGHMAVAFKRWGVRYRSFSQNRFNTLSKSGGGGIWPPLAEVTKRRRRKQRKGYRGKRRWGLLRDTSLLFYALQAKFTGAGGQWEQAIPGGIEVGYGGDAVHKDAGGKGGKATIADIAMFHQTGAGNLPVREIIVDPDPPTITGMIKDLTLALKRIERDTDKG